MASLFAAPAASASLLVEDFSTLDHADLGATTGVWNAVQNAAQAGAVSNGDPTRPISFGDGSDGVLSSANGYTFDTDQYPNGYNFVSVSITGGTITVQGSNPLTIRSLLTVAISPTMDVSGPSGGASQTSSVAVAGASGAIARACGSSGGAGGGIAAALTAENGGPGDLPNGTAVTVTGGTASNTSGTSGGVGGNAGGTPASNGSFDSSPINCGGGGGGGGAYFASGAGATGGAGGAGGGEIHIASIGSITVGTVLAGGGNGGTGANSGASCSGGGAGGQGGAVWLQSLGTIDTQGVEPNVSGGTDGNNGTCGVNGAEAGGLNRADSPSDPVGWPGPGSDYLYSTVNAAPGLSYIVQSTAYDLGTFNATFSGAPVLATVLNGGTISAQYAASADGVKFTPFTADITALSGQGYRYLKFQLTITTGSSAAPSPEVTQVAVSYGDAGVPSLDLGLAAGCGSMRAVEGGKSRPSGGPRGLWFWLGAWILAWSVVRIRLKLKHEGLI